MPMLIAIIILLAALLIAVMFGPVVVIFTSMLAAIGIVGLGAIAAGGVALVVSLYLIAAFGWVIWWFFQPTEAMAALHAAEAAKRARQ